jgi:hypothetical protein
VALAAKQPPVSTATVGAHKPIWVEMALQPQQAEAIIKEVGNRKVDHGILTQIHVFRGKYTTGARLLDMSLASKIDGRPCSVRIVKSRLPQIR